MRVLVTGGAGFIGSNFVRRILDGSLAGFSSVTVLDKLTYAGNLANLADQTDDRRLTFVTGDVRDFDLVADILMNQDAVVHFAAESHVDRSIAGAEDFVLTNVLGTQVVLDAVRLRKVETMVHVSTDEVYGSIPSGSWHEDEPLLPNSPYAATKASSDLLARAYHQTFGIDVRTTRCSNNYGPFQYPEKLIPLFITNLIDDLSVPLYGTGSNVRDWLHVDDHCEAIHRVLMHGSPGRTYNIGGGRELSNLELTTMILNLMGKDGSFVRHVEDRKGHDLRYSVSIARISEELGYSPSVDFESGLAATVAWYQENEAWWRPLKSASDQGSAK